MASYEEILTNLKKSETINIELSPEGVVISLKNGSFSEKLKNEICAAFARLLKGDSSSLCHPENHSENEIDILGKAMQVDLYSEDGDYFGDVDWDLSEEDERKLEKYDKAADVAADYNIYIKNEKINALDATDEANKLFDGFDRDWFAPLFVKCNGQSFKTFDAARKKAEEIHNLIYGDN